MTQWIKFVSCCVIALLIAGVLNLTDPVAKAELSPPKIVEKEFGKEVADLVDGVTKISAFENSAGANSKVENFRKLILATSKDIGFC